MRQLAACLAFALLVSCSAAPPPPVPVKSAIDEQKQAIEKAKAVQQVVDQQKRDTDRQIDAAEAPPAKKDP